jgi:excisionase family DNA binding protein
MVRVYPGVYPCVLTTGQLARHLGLSRRKVNDLCDAGRIVSYRLDGGNHDRRIRLEQALSFAHSEHQPYESLEDLAEAQGCTIPLRCPSLLIVSPSPGFVLPILTGLFDATLAASSFRAALILGRRTFNVVILDAAIGTEAGRELLDFLAERSPTTFRGALVGEDEETSSWVSWGSEAAWQKPIAWRRMAAELYQSLANPRSSGTPTPRVQPSRRAA